MPRLMNGSNCSSVVANFRIPDVLPHWHCVNSLNVPEEQNAKTSVFVEVVASGNDQLIV